LLRIRCCLSLTEALAYIDLPRAARRQGGPEAVARVGGPSEALRTALACRTRSLMVRRIRASLGVMALP
jgi:hypothetical protein